jgi:hypothetical protein
VGEQVHRRLAEPQRVVDAGVPLATPAVDVVRDAGPERRRLPTVQIGRSKVHKGHAEPGQGGVGEPAAGNELVVLLAVVAEALFRPGHHDPVALPAEQRAARHPDQQAQQREVEQQVPGLLQVTLLAAHGEGIYRFPFGGPNNNTEPARPQHPAQPLRGRRGIAVVGQAAGVCGQPLQPLRSLRRDADQRADVRVQARHEASDERDEQQQVDR